MKNQRTRCFVSQNSFSLTELLFVVAILLLLCGLLLPSLKSLKKSAQQTVCLSNLRQIGIGLSAYSGDYNGKVPPLYAALPGDPDPYSKAWYSYSWKYFQTGQTRSFGTRDAYLFNHIHPRNIFRCPSTDLGQRVPAPSVVAAQSTAYCYGFNLHPAYIANYPIASNSNFYLTYPLDRKSVRNSSEVAMVVESTSIIVSASGFQQLYGMVPHHGGMNVIFFDNHAGWIKYNDIPVASGPNGFWH